VRFRAARKARLTSPRNSRETTNGAGSRLLGFLSSVRRAAKYVVLGASLQRIDKIGVFPAFLILSALLLSCSKPPTENHSAAAVAQTRPTIVFMTDFGTANDAVAICKAVMIGIAPDSRIMDITHQVTPFSIEEGARFLTGVTPYYPAGTVFVVVIDPGVGTSRKAVIVKTKKGQYFVLPDNGLISPVIDRDGLQAAREITNPGWMIGDNVSSTFHGRDIFSPAGAHLAAGWDYTLAGPEVQELVRLTPKMPTVTDKGIQGEVIALDDPFGSLITDISGDEFKKLGYNFGDKVTVQLNKKPFTLPYGKTFMDVPVGAPLLYQDSRGRMGLAINQGNFSQVHKITPPVPLFVPKKSSVFKSKQ
jgi:S-adenosylmethionine hydrolase